MPLIGEAATDAAESENLCMRRHSKRENREILLVSNQMKAAPSCRTPNYGSGFGALAIISVSSPSTRSDRSGQAVLSAVRP